MALRDISRQEVGNAFFLLVALTLRGGFAFGWDYMRGAEWTFERWVGRPDIRAGVSEGTDKAIGFLFRFAQICAAVSAIGFLTLSAWLALIQRHLRKTRLGQNKPAMDKPDPASS